MPHLSQSLFLQLHYDYVIGSSNNMHRMSYVIETKGYIRLQGQHIIVAKGISFYKPEIGRDSLAGGRYFGKLSLRSPQIIFSRKL